MKAGSYIDAVRDVESLMGRCYIDPDTACWHFRGANGQKFRYVPGQPLQVFVHQLQRKTTLKRAAWMLSGKPEVPKTHRLVMSCLCWDCANPAHVRQVTAQTHTRILAAAGAFKTPAKVAAARRNARSRSRTVLTPELAQWARESPQTQADIGHALGIRQNRVSDIVRGKTWRDQSAPPASVWDWRPA